MERVAFLIEETGEHIGCLLNPASFTVRRQAGVQRRRSLGGQLSGAGLADDPLLYTGGGYTELQLDLLFDVSLSRASPPTGDVRDFTGPLSRLAENVSAPDRYGRPPIVRFVWGKSWNVPGVITAVAERFEQFDASGMPRRSWLRMRLVRVAEQRASSSVAGTSPLNAFSRPDQGLAASRSPSEVALHEVTGAGFRADGSESRPAGGERLDVIANRFYGNPELWRLLAEINRIDDPLHIPPGTLLQIPPLSGEGTPK